MGAPVICARIAVQLAFREYRTGRVALVDAGSCPRIVLRTLPVELSSILRLALHSLGAYLDMGFTSQEWLHCVLEAAHFGSSFRRCFFFDYKEQRRAYPRVTNRGVQTSDTASNSRKRKVKVNA